MNVNVCSAHDTGIITAEPHASTYVMEAVHPGFTIDMPCCAQNLCLPFYTGLFRSDASQEKQTIQQTNKQAQRALQDNTFP